MVRTIAQDTRAARRKGFSHEQRVLLLEDDADEFESGMDGVRAEIKNQTRVLWGILISLLVTLGGIVGTLVVNT